MKALKLSLVIITLVGFFNMNAQVLQKKAMQQQKSINIKFAKMDLNNDGRITYKEYSKYKIATKVNRRNAKVVQSKRVIKNELKKNFAQIDRNNNGFISKNEMVAKHNNTVSIKGEKIKKMRNLKRNKTYNNLRN